MPTEVIVQTDPTGWAVAVALGIVVLMLVVLYKKKIGTPGPFRVYDEVDGKNHAEGDKGRWLLLFVLAADSRALSLEIGRRVGPCIRRKNDEEIFMTSQNSMWYLGTVPIAFVWSDRYQVISPIAAEAIIDFAEEKKATTFDEVRTAAETDTEKKDREIAPNTIVRFAEYYPLTARTHPALAYAAARALLSDEHGGSGILDWLKKNPLIVVGVIVALVLLVTMMGGK